MKAQNRKRILVASTALVALIGLSACHAHGYGHGRGHGYHGKAHVHGHYDRGDRDHGRDERRERRGYRY